MAGCQGIWQTPVIFHFLTTSLFPDDFVIFQTSTELQKAAIKLHRHALIINGLTYLIVTQCKILQTFVRQLHLTISNKKLSEFCSFWMFTRYFLYEFDTCNREQILLLTCHDCNLNRWTKVNRKKQNRLKNNTRQSTILCL